MQGKVSMVMPCYNKAEYIGEMLDSVIAQKWNSIQLILVNDGSTDGTRGLIEEYALRIKARGYELIIIDQTNAGVCAAAKAGLEQVSGEYVCMVDSDDMLNSEYVSEMAGWLENNKEYDIAFCGFASYRESGDNKVFGEEQVLDENDFNMTVQHYLYGKIRPTVWSYMLRKSYFDKCGITSTYFTETKGSHEPGFMIPMTAHGGRAYNVRRALYYHNKSDISAHSVHDSYEKCSKFYDEYYYLCIKAISALPDSVADTSLKEALRLDAEFFRNIEMLNRVENLEEGEKHRKVMIHALAKSAERVLNSPKEFLPENINKQVRRLMTAVRSVPPGFTRPANRIVGYGALGRMALYWLGTLKNTPLFPSELWDIKGNGEDIMKPDLPSLKEGDLLLCFPKGEVESELRVLFKDLKCQCWYSGDIEEWYIMWREMWRNYYSPFTSP